MRSLLAALPAALALLPAGACSRAPDLVVYTALDQVYSEPVLRSFEERTGLRVEARYDTEANKTVGLVNALIAEARRPRADVFWNNETAQTIRLKHLGLTQAYSSPATEAVPAAFRDPEGHWTGFAARARVILYRKDLFPEGAGPPARVADMLAAPYALSGGMARPLTGTTLTHFAALASLQGPDAVEDWLGRALDSGLRFGRGNAHVMRRVCEGDFAWCLTDTDDAAAARRNGYPVEILYPDQEAGGLGTLVIPNTLCILAAAPHPDAARRFVDFVLSGEVEGLLARGGSDQIPLRPGVEAPAHVALPGRDFRPMQVDWEAVARSVEEVLPRFQELFTG